MGRLPDSRIEPPRRSMTTVSYEVREVSSGEVATLVLPLWREGMSDPQIIAHVEQRHAWLYRQRAAGATRTWVVRDGCDHSVLGACSVVPRRLTLHGKSFLAGLLADFIVRADARSAGPALALQQGLAEQSCDRGFDFLYGSPNRKAWPIFKRLGYKAVSSTRCWVKPLRRDRQRVEKVIEPRLRARLSPGASKRLTALLAPPVALAAQAALRGGEQALAAWAALRGYRSRLGPMVAAPPELVPTRSLDAMWPTRDEPGYLAWRYADHPTHTHFLFELLRAGTTRAWVVLRLRGTSAEVQDADWAADDPGLPGLAWWLLPRYVRKLGATVLSISCAGNRATEATLRSSLYVERQEDRKLIVYVPASADAGLASELAIEDSWRLFAGELDI